MPEKPLVEIVDIAPPPTLLDAAFTLMMRCDWDRAAAKYAEVVESALRSGNLIAAVVAQAQFVACLSYEYVCTRSEKVLWTLHIQAKVASMYLAEVKVLGTETALGYAIAMNQLWFCGSEEVSRAQLLVANLSRVLVLRNDFSPAEYLLCIMASHEDVLLGRETDLMEMQAMNITFCRARKDGRFSEYPDLQVKFYSFLASFYVLYANLFLDPDDPNFRRECAQKELDEMQLLVDEMSGRAEGNLMRTLFDEAQQVYQEAITPQVPASVPSEITVTVLSNGTMGGVFDLDSLLAEQ